MLKAQCGVLNHCWVIDKKCFGALIAAVRWVTHSHGGVAMNTIVCARGVALLSRTVDDSQFYHWGPSWIGVR